jgi:deoxyribodipyrimidine photo-lyase
MYQYDFSALEQAITHDKLWNAAQTEMVVKGYMHNYMRMVCAELVMLTQLPQSVYGGWQYWCKQLILWTSHPATAFQYAILLNDK